MGSLSIITMNYYLSESMWVCTCSTALAHCLHYNPWFASHMIPDYLLHMSATCLLSFETGAYTFLLPSACTFSIWPLYNPLASHIHVFSNRPFHTPTQRLPPIGPSGEPGEEE
jgi:hypothetical protein